MAEQIGFSPNRFARGLRLSKTATIGLIVPDIANPFFGAIAHQIAVGTHKRGYSILLCDSQEDVAIERQSLDLLRNWQVEGVVVCPVGQTADHLAEVIAAGLPLVFVDRYFPDLQAPYVGCDNAAGARAAVEHLLAKGHRHIACLQGLCGTTPNDQRLSGYREAQAAHQIPFDASLIVGDSFTEECGYRETRRLLTARSDVTALLCFCNLSAGGDPCVGRGRPQDPPRHVDHFIRREPVRGPSGCPFDHRYPAQRRDGRRGRPVAVRADPNLGRRLVARCRLGGSAAPRRPASHAFDCPSIGTKTVLKRPPGAYP